MADFTFEFSEVGPTMKINQGITAKKLEKKAENLFELSARKIRLLEKRWDPDKGAPVFTAAGKYVSRGWTDWTQGFQFGSALLQFDATGESSFLDLGRSKIVKHMAHHVSNTGVHDHGFNNVSTYGNLWRLMLEDKIPHNDWERTFYEMALKVSGAVQASRWSAVGDGQGFIYSFNGPHSLFVDTIRSLRSLALAYHLNHSLMGEGDQKISLLERFIRHGTTTAEYNIFYGEQRDAYDESGRTAHETIFNMNDGSYRCPGTQQGYSPFSTWTRGLAWAILGYAEQLEFLRFEFPAGHKDYSTVNAARKTFLKAATVTAEFYLKHSCADGIPVWDTGAPNLERLGAYLTKPSDPFNHWEPLDSSAAAIAAQGFIRLGNYLSSEKNSAAARKYREAGFTIANTLFQEPYLSTEAAHEGLILHSVYHRPKGWDYVARGQKIPNGESSMWGDYHARELALLILREARGENYPCFFGVARDGRSRTEKM